LSYEKPWQKKIVEKLQHMHMNPVKWSLVSHPEDWLGCGLYLEPAGIMEQFIVQLETQTGVDPY